MPLLSHILNHPLFLGLAVSIEEFISETSAREVLDMLFPMLRYVNKTRDILRALEGVRFRGARLAGQLEHARGSAYMELNMISEAESHLRNALAIQRDLINKQIISQIQIVNSLNSLGILLSDTGRTSEAESVFKQALEICQSYSESIDEDVVTDCAMPLLNLGNLYSIMELHEEALRVQNEAKQIYLKMIEDGNETQYQPLANTLNSIALTQIQMGRFQDAEQSYLEALQIRASLASQHQLYKADLASTLMNLGTLNAQFGQYERATSFLQQALNELEDLKNTSSDPSLYDADIAMISSNLGQSLVKTGNTDEAKRKLEEAVNIYRRLAKLAPDKFNQFLAESLNNLSVIHLRLGELETAESLSREFLAIFRDLANRQEALHSSRFAHSLIARGNILSAQDKFDEARELFQESLVLFEKLSSTGIHRMKFNISCALNGLALIELKLGNYEEAEPLLNQVLNIRRELAESHPTVYPFEQAKTLVNLGTLYRKMNRSEDAESQYRECIEVCMSASYTVELAESMNVAVGQLYSIYIEDRGMTESQAKSLVDDILDDIQKRLEGSGPDS